MAFLRLPEYHSSWFSRDLLAGIVIWSVVVPQAVAYAQIAGLPPQAGLMAAPGALAAYALLGTSRTLVVSATTATSAVSAAAVGALAGGDAARFAALSAALALITAAALTAAGLLRLGRITDFVSKPVMTGFLFGLGLTVTIAQVPALLGGNAGDGDFFQRAASLATDPGDVNTPTVIVGAASIVLLVVLARAVPKLPATLAVLVLAILASALLGLDDRGVDVVGDLPRAVPQLTVPDFSLSDAVALLPAAIGMMIVSAEAIGVSRAIAATDGYSVDPNRDLIALAASNLAAGLSSGFVQSGGASQTMAAERAGGKTQLASLVAATLVLLTGAFLAPLFHDLPQATLAAIVVVAIASFFRVDELRRYSHLRRSALWLSLLALAGVVVLGVLPGLLIAAAVSLVVVIQRLSRPPVGRLVRDPDTGAWGRADRHPDWPDVDDIVAARIDAPLFYANAEAVMDQLLAIVRDADPPPQALVLDLGGSADFDVNTVDMLHGLAKTLEADNIELRLSGVHTPARQMLEHSHLLDRLTVRETLDAAAGVQAEQD